MRGIDDNIYIVRPTLIPVFLNRQSADETRVSAVDLPYGFPSQSDCFL